MVYGRGGFPLPFEETDMREVNPLDIILRILGMILLALGATLGAGGRQPSEDSASSSPALPPAPVTPTFSPGGDMPTNPVPHVISTVEIFVLESFPVQISLGVIGYQADGCTFPVQVTQSRTGNTITVNIFRDVPINVMCTMQVIEDRETIMLEGTFDPGTYTIIVNDQTVMVTI
jgi:hypothetical protein